MTHSQIKKLTTLGMLSAFAYLSVFLLRIPIIPAAPFLKYEPKDIIILMAGFIFGPLSAIAVSVVVSFVELITISTTGIIGFIMNVLSTVAYVAPAAYIYHREKTTRSAAVSLIAGTIIMTAVMLLWNFLLTPLYMNVPRSVVIGLLGTAVLPFNLLKAGINSILAFILYKPLVTTLRKAKLVEEGSASQKAQKQTASRSTN